MACKLFLERCYCSKPLRQPLTPSSESPACGSPLFLSTAMPILALSIKARAAQVQRYRAQMSSLATVAPSATRLGFTMCSGKSGKEEPVIWLLQGLQQQCCTQLRAGSASNGPLFCASPGRVALLLRDTQPGPPSCCKLFALLPPVRCCCSATACCRRRIPGQPASKQQHPNERRHVATLHQVAVLGVQGRLCGRLCHCHDCGGVSLLCLRLDSRNWKVCLGGLFRPHSLHCVYV